MCTSPYVHISMDLLTSGLLLQGDRANGMYFVESGTLVVLKTMGHEGDEKAVNEVQQGEYFGELALVNHAPRAATVSAKDDVRVACKSTITIREAILRKNLFKFEQCLMGEGAVKI